MKKILWGIWLILSLALAGFLGVQISQGGSQDEFMPGAMTHGHHQIELQCDACHTSPFGGDDMLQDACMNCHGEELKVALDSHPKTKFTNPRNADLIKVLDARYCASCHIEHNPDILHPMGVTHPTDFCMQCHQDIGEDRESHAGMGFETCASAGCHNFHDNRALYEDFLLKHQQDVVPTERAQPETELQQYILTMGTSWDKDATPSPAAEAAMTDEIHASWLASAHGEAQVGCDSCHTVSNTNTWLDKPGIEQCQSCHEPEAEGFLAGKHGMRIAAGLSPMTPAQARQPMQLDDGNAHRELTCNSCHSAHQYDRVEAATSACLSCHADDHSQAFNASPHGALWQQVEQGQRPMEEAVSCATCHMPREVNSVFGTDIVQVQHNQNANLRPNEKMIRPTCMQCHTLSFSIDALADPALIENNFNGQPSTHIESIDMAVERDQSHQQRKAKN